VRPGWNFSGWPWILQSEIIRIRATKGKKHPDARRQSHRPRLLVQAHSASLNLCFYTGETNFPSNTKATIFATFHGSWNRMKRTGYKVVRVPLDKSTAKRAANTKTCVTGSSRDVQRGPQLNRRLRRDEAGYEVSYRRRALPVDLSSGTRTTFVTSTFHAVP